jgi:hypothetical protein
VDDFLDYGHLGRPGAETYTRAIGRLIIDEHLLTRATTTQATPQARLGPDSGHP